jgi:hypothetical protein
MTTSTASEHPFVSAFNGSFINMLRWEQLDGLWQAVRNHVKLNWYVYAVGEPPPATPAEPAQLERFLTEIDDLLHQEHDEDYCGIVYADDREHPRFIKIYDPNNLGAVCGSTGAPPPLPGWILSTIEPVDLNAALPPPGGRRRWWRKLFGG